MRERSKAEAHFTIIPNEVLRDETISIKARGLLALLMTYSDDWQFNAAHLQGVSGMGRDQFEGAMRELRQAGYVETITCRDDKGRLDGKKWIIRDKAHRSPENPCVGEVTEALKNRVLEKPYAGKPAPIRRTSSEEDQSIKEEQCDFSENGNFERGSKGFEDFCAIYPRLDNETNAKKAYVKALKNGADPSTILRAAKIYAAEADKRRTEKQYLKTARTWLDCKWWEELAKEEEEESAAERRRRRARMEGETWMKIYT